MMGDHGPDQSLPRKGPDARILAIRVNCRTTHQPPFSLNDSFIGSRSWPQDAMLAKFSQSLRFAFASGTVQSLGACSCIASDFSPWLHF